jgi:17beta-estradiol 17-dehydrogenase / very-long-chain 3-oxoacyl-CoA reductase
MHLLTISNISIVFTGLLIVYCGCRILSFIYLYIRPSALARHLTDGAYALVTGATDGIGKAIATELAAYGFNLVLHGRNMDKLNTVQQQLQAEYPGCKIITICQDGSDQPLLDTSSIKGVPVKVLVNNVGIGPVSPLASSSVDDITRTVNLNVLFPTYLTRAFLATGQPPSLIVNISSYAGLLPPPFLSVYAGTKAYNNAFSKALSVELGNTSVISMLVGSVHTGANKKPVSFTRPDAQTFAKRVLKVVGTRRKSVYPYWPHAVQTSILSMLPARFIDQTMRKAMQLNIPPSATNPSAPSSML